MPVVGRYSYRFTFFWHPCHIWSELGILICSPVERERERIRLLDTFLYYAMELIIYAHICSIDIQNISNEVTSGSDTSSHPSAPGLSKFPDPPDVGFLRLIAIFEDLKLQCMSWYFFVSVKHMKLKWISWTCDVHRNLWILAKIVCELHCHIILFFCFFCHNSLGITYLSSGRLSSDQLIVVFLPKGVAYREVSKYPLLDKLYSVNTQDWRVFWLFNIFIYLLL